MFTDLPMTAQTTYAQLVDATVAAELVRTVADLTGSFASKQVKGRTYWYFQYTLPGGKTRQNYVGPDSSRLRAMMDTKLHPPATTEQIQRLANAAQALGCQALLKPHYRVVKRLSEFGFFRAGGVLVGTHAFLAYGNMLGVKWGSGARTQDVDFAHAGKNLSIALPGNVQVDTHSAIKTLEMGFLPISGASYMNQNNPEFQIDFLAPMHRGDNKPYQHTQLKIPLQPVKFIEFALEDVQQAVVFCARGAVTVNVPHPARYALTKLIVYSNRTATQAAKANKDLEQCAALLSYYRQQNSWMVEDAWQDLINRGHGWAKRARRGLVALKARAPELAIGDWLSV